MRAKKNPLFGKKKQSRLPRVGFKDRREARKQINAVSDGSKPSKKAVTTTQCMGCKKKHTTIYKGPAAKLPKAMLNVAGSVGMIGRDPNKDGLNVVRAATGQYKSKTTKIGKSKRKDVKRLAQINKKISNTKPSKPVNYTGFGGAGKTGYVYSEKQAKQLSNYSKQRNSILNKYKK